MKKETRTVVYDDELRIEAYRFEGIVQPFPNHFHEYYVIGFIEDGHRVLSCRNQEYALKKGNILLFNPGDNHACVQSDDGTLDYRGFNITKEVMLNLAEEVTGHLAALVTILIWGTTFISTKVLLVYFEPIEILFFRFILGFLALLIVYPHRMKGTTKRLEAVFAAARLCDVCLYYLLENIALTYTIASNVGVIISIAPFFTAILTHLFTKKEKLRANFFIGFVVAMVGICLISLNGAKMQLNPIGDLLAVAAAVVWACYSVLTRKISGFGYHTIQTTRQVFAYSIIFMIPALFLFDCRIGAERFANPVYLGNLIFLGLGASALCFVTWNMAVKVLGAVKTSIYIYLVPVITVITSALILKEKVSVMSGVGMVLALIGLFLSEYRGKTQK